MMWPRENNGDSTPERRNKNNFKTETVVSAWRKLKPNRNSNFQLSHQWLYVYVVSICVCCSLRGLRSLQRSVSDHLLYVYVVSICVCMCVVACVDSVPCSVQCRPAGLWWCQYSQSMSRWATLCNTYHLYISHAGQLVYTHPNAQTVPLHAHTRMHRHPTAHTAPLHARTHMHKHSPAHTAGEFMRSVLVLRLSCKWIGKGVNKL